MKKNIFLVLSISILSFVLNAANDPYSNDSGAYVNFDAAYEHDQKLIDNKVDELRSEQQQYLLTGSFEQLDNIILEDALLKTFDQWKGTKYRFGGDSETGIDCSALTRRVYRSVFSYELPRVSVDQIKEGSIVDRNSLKPGDILYFRPENRVNHVAVYVGNSLFINASSSKGVILSSLESNYWGKYFLYGVRVSKARTSK